MIASSAFFVFDAILDWPVSLYDGSWSQWGQMASSATTSGSMLTADSPWRTDVPSRSELVVYTNDVTPGPVFYTSVSTTVTGLNNMAASGTFTGTANRTFRVQIDSVGAPDTFSWFKSAPSQTIPDAAGVAITAGVPQTLTEGMVVTFSTSTGHTLGDRWELITKRPVEVLALDGSICSSRLNLDGTITKSSTGCTPLLPNSYAATANQIEEADSVYFGVGGGSSGGGGGPIAPGY